MSLARSTATELYEAPEWAIGYLSKLKLIVGTELDVRVYSAVDNVFEGKRIGVTDNPDGYTIISKDKPPIIVLKNSICDDDKGKNLLCHEFIHALHGEVDSFVMDGLSDEEKVAYYNRVEKLVHPVAILLRLADFLNAEYVQD